MKNLSPQIVDNSRDNPEISHKTVIDSAALGVVGDSRAKEQS